MANKPTLAEVTLGTLRERYAKLEPEYRKALSLLDGAYNAWLDARDHARGLGDELERVKEAMAGMEGEADGERPTA